MNLFIGCSSREDIPDKYFKDCEILLDKLFQQDFNLVFGAYNQGLMKLSYNKALEYKHQVIGISPKIFQDDFKNLNCNREIITKSISKRTERLIEESDILLFLPGGIGTIYELLSAIESKRSGEFDKPIIIYNSCGFFDELFLFLEKTYQEKFSPEVSVRTSMADFKRLCHNKWLIFDEK